MDKLDFAEEARDRRKQARKRGEVLSSLNHPVLLVLWMGTLSAKRHVFRARKRDPFFNVKKVVIDD